MTVGRPRYSGSLLLIADIYLPQKLLIFISIVQKDYLSDPPINASWHKRGILMHITVFPKKNIHFIQEIKEITLILHFFVDEIYEF